MPRRRVGEVLDDVDSKILRLLLEYPGWSEDQLSKAEGVGLTPSALRHRTRRLQRLNFLSYGWHVAAKNPAYPFRLLILINLDLNRLAGSDLKNPAGLMRAIETARKNHKYKESVFVEDAHDVLGEFDMSVRITATDLHLAGQFIVDTIGKAPGVVRTSTLVSILWSKHIDDLQVKPEKRRGRKRQVEGVQA